MVGSVHAEPSPRVFPAWQRAGMAAAVCLMILLRTVALGSDAYPRLSWSAALLTDEGFYIHNARNVILFGKMSTDDFNNALIMPALHLLQVGVFRAIGVGANQARLISVALSLVTLALFYAALRRAFGLWEARIGLLLLGLDHVNVLYNRLALMDTPAAFVLVCVFYAWVRSRDCAEDGVGRTVWLGLCGALLGLAYSTRSLAGLLFPVPFLVLMLHGGAQGAALTRSVRREGAAIGAGLAAAMALYGVLWYLPHRAELTRVNRYYMVHQLIPGSVARLVRDVTVAVFGDDRGMSPYLVRHTPIQFVLALAVMATVVIGVRRIGWRETARRTDITLVYLLLWLAVCWLFFALVSYAPDRYYVLFYPALAAVAAWCLVRVETVIQTVLSSRSVCALFAGFLAYHVGEALLHHRSHLTDALLAVLVAGAAWAAARLPDRWPGAEPISRTWAARMAPAALILWIGVNGYWTGDWLAHLSYRQRAADRWLAQNLPPDSVLIGDVAPGLCMNNRFRAVNVIPGLCNYRSPLESFTGHPREIVILDGKWKEPWWTRHYPSLVALEPPMHRFDRLDRFPVGVYRVR